MRPRYHDLATYNAEVARGIVHTPEWESRMAEEQARSDVNSFTVHGGVSENLPFMSRYTRLNPGDVVVMRPSKDAEIARLRAIVYEIEALLSVLNGGTVHECTITPDGTIVDPPTLKQGDSIVITNPEVLYSP